jgi:hypothetical protein
MVAEETRMRRPAPLAFALGLILALGLAVASLAQPTLPAARIDVPVKQWVALTMPEKGKGPTGPLKHLTAAVNPDNGRIYMTGGDYDGLQFSQQSYRQETWSLSLAERWANRTDRNAGWRLEYPYCGPVGQVQPKHPDFVGWTWDSKRKVFWMVPGVMERLSDSSNCPGETGTRASDPGFLYNRIMQFDPETRRWRDVSGNAGSFIDTWMSVYDPKTDTLIRFSHSGSHGSLVSTYSIAEDRWGDRVLPLNAVRRDIRIKKEYLAVDYADRMIYVIDGISGRLHRYGMDAGKMEDLGPVPGGAHGSENQMMVVWDSVSRVLLWFLETKRRAHAYHPGSRRWEELPLIADPPDAMVQGRMLVYDPQQNVMLLLGGLPANPHMLVFRYGEGR